MTKDITKELEFVKSVARATLALNYYNKECVKLTFTDMTDAFTNEAVGNVAEKLVEIRDEFVDAGNHEFLLKVIAHTVSQHNHEVKMNAELDRIAEEDAKKQAELDAKTETEIAHIFDDYLAGDRTTYPFFKIKDKTCSLAVFASISENSFAVKYFQHMLDHDHDATITFDLVYDCDCIEPDTMLEEVEAQLSDLRADIKSAIERADFDEIEFLKERIENISL